MVVADGKPVFNDIKKTKAYGLDMRLEKNEGQVCLQNIYRQALRMYLMHHNFAGQYPASSDLRKPFLKNVRIGAWTRYTNEGTQGIHQNDRPLPGWLMELITGMYLFTADDIVVWSSDTNVIPGKLGADVSKAWNWKYGHFGFTEFLLKAMHRYSTLDPLHHGAFKWCWFRLPIVDENKTDGERYDQKPLVFGKIRTYEGKPWLEMFAAWPALDGQPAEFKVWIDKDGQRSAAYTIELANGRSYFYDAWQLPAEFKDIDGKNVWIRFKDPLGKVRTWRGDWREKVDESVATPADFTAGKLNKPCYNFILHP